MWHLSFIRHHFSQVLVVDLDGRDFYTVVGDEETILPKKLTLALERALKVCSMSSWEGADTDDELSEGMTFDP